MRWRFSGDISGVGTTSGHRFVLGRWTSSPFGPFADVMAEDPDGVRTLLAPDDAVATFVSETYRFDRVEVVEIDAARDGSAISCSAGPLELRLDVGDRTALGHLLRLVPDRLATSPAWCAAIDPAARSLLRGVRTRGSAGGGRREWYGATDQRRLTAVRAAWGGTDLGTLADVWPPVRFGFSSTPRRPTVVDVTTTVELP
ncbi:hypothetical protein [Dermatobacter hominis]|uniref:hypothetical protein n=1 Tax=Dermatobacter hominis TaxID=2884263 RepID=UPI001D10B0D4|nr:hypothetical protein [Dermatobacter hominis]UDY37551.1 hypothetical protein LH044_08420 [Dermatobacter hominis]